MIEEYKGFIIEDWSHQIGYFVHLSFQIGCFVHLSPKYLMKDGRLLDWYDEIIPEYKDVDYSVRDKMITFDDVEEAKKAIDNYLEKT
jgi:hypothetical protein